MAKSKRKLRRGTKEFQRRSRAARKGWRARKVRESSQSAIVRIEGPHQRNALSKDWDGFKDIDRIAKTAREDFPDATAWMFSFKLKFVTDPDTGEGEERWVSIPMAPDLKNQIRNAKDYLSVFQSGKMNYGLVIPTAVTVVVAQTETEERRTNATKEKKRARDRAYYRQKVGRKANRKAGNRAKSHSSGRLRKMRKGKGKR
jgi:hypothetical protein